MISLTEATDWKHAENKDQVQKDLAWQVLQRLREDVLQFLIPCNYQKLTN
jgi:hypothetical protein